MSSAVADSLANGDANRVLTTMSTGNPEPVRRSNAVQTDKFAGKSREDIVEMYRNLESHSGRVASDLGATRGQLNEALAVTKRLADLSTNAPPETRQDSPINGVDLVANPKPVLDRLLADHEAKLDRKYSARINTLEQQLSMTRFQANHPNVQWDDPALAAFVRETPLRMTLNEQAKQGNANAADALLTEFKQYQSLHESRTDSGRRAAEHVTLENGVNPSSETSSGRPAGKIYNRADIIALRQADPDKYYSDAVQAEIGAAYREGRVK